MDLGKAVISIPCPECQFSNEVTLEQVAAGDSIICVGCLKTIQLVDDGAGTNKAIKDVNQGINRLKDSLK